MSTYEKGHPVSFEESRQAVLQHIQTGHHIFQTYSDVHFLTDTAGLFIGEGLQRGEGIVIVATPVHRRAFLSWLEDRRYDPEIRIEQGQLILLDAQELLNLFSQGDCLKEKTFQMLLREILNKAGARLGKRVRIYGEMVDLLYQNGHASMAVQLEELWNRLGEHYSFSLFCAYGIDPLNSDLYDGTLQSICRTHSHFIPVKDKSALEAAVSRALEETVGHDVAGNLQTVETPLKSLAAMPDAQSRLLWLYQNMPGIGKKVLQLTQLYYRPTLS